MPTTIDSPYTPEQIKVWFRGLLTIAWADGHFDEEEKSLITSMTQEEFAPNIGFFDAIEPISSEEPYRAGYATVEARGACNWQLQA